jgi:ADP-ribosyl-[dinitrogen reductase] hydrolase
MTHCRAVLTEDQAVTLRTGATPVGVIGVAHLLQSTPMPSNSRTSDVVARAQGCLLGQATGDALGTTVEFQDAESIAQAYPDKLRDLAGGGPFDLLPGQVTDDTELALALARALVHDGQYDDDAVAGRYHAWYRSGPFDVGTTTASALQGPFEKGSELAEQMRAAALRSSQSNGSLMRQSPLGIFGWRMEAEQLAALSCLDSTLTHPNPTCQEACVAYTHAIAGAIRTGSPASTTYAQVLVFMGKRPAAMASGVLAALERAADAPPAEFYHQQGWVLIALQNAFYRLLHAPSLEDGVVDTVACGGDTDTNGCIAGALLGAVHGVDAVPDRWKQVLLSCRSPRPGMYACTDLLELAEALCSSPQQGSIG